MKAVILAGGFGTRLVGHSGDIPKPLVEVNGRPIILEIMDLYRRFGVKEFVVALGYQQEKFKAFFRDYVYGINDLSITFSAHDFQINCTRRDSLDDVSVSLVDTGLHTQTGGRLKRLQDYLGDDDFFCTYGDGLANVDLSSLSEFHKAHGGAATVTAVRPIPRFGEIELEQSSSRVSSFEEKPSAQVGWINGGFFIFSKMIFECIRDDNEPLEGLPLKRLVEAQQLFAYQHSGFWQCMDTKRDLDYLNRLAASGKKPWL